MWGNMTTLSTLTGEASSVLVQLIVYRMRTSECVCESLKKHSVSIKCSRCRVLTAAKEHFPTDYFAACELMAINPAVSK